MYGALYTVVRHHSTLAVAVFASKKDKCYNVSLRISTNISLLIPNAMTTCPLFRSGTRPANAQECQLPTACPRGSTEKLGGK